MLAQALIFLIRIYQLTLSKLLGPVCRFEPSCSRYAAECLRLHGAARGSWLSVRRLSRCHPFHPGGYDPPPLPLPRARLERAPVDKSPSAQQIGKID
jgi:putative membrane protein insertion efficiency factor